MATSSCERSEDPSLSVSREQRMATSSCERSEDPGLPVSREQRMATSSCERSEDPSLPVSRERRSFWTILSRIYHYDVNPFYESWMLYPFFVDRVLVVFAGLSGSLNGLQLFSNGDKFWGFISIVAMFLPFVFTSLTNLLEILSFYGKSCKKSMLRNESSEDIAYTYEDDLERKRPIFKWGFKHLPFLQGMHGLKTCHGLMSMKGRISENSFLLKKMLSSSDDVTIRRAWLQTGPETMLLLHIVFTTGNYGPLQIAGICFNLASLVLSSVRQFFCARIGQRSLHLTPLGFYTTVCFLLILEVLFSATIAGSLVLVSRGYGMFFSIPFIVICNVLMAYFLGYPKEFERRLEDFRNTRNDPQIHKLRKEIPKRVKMNALTSWMSNTTIVQSSSSLYILSAVITIAVYAATTGIFMHPMLIMERSSLEDYSLLICLPENSSLISAEYLNKKETFYNSWSAITFQNQQSFILKSIRLCNENESSTDWLWYVIWITVSSYVFKLGANFGLYCLSKDKKCGKSVSKSYFFARTCNRKDPTTGETMMHILAKELSEETWDSFLRLYKEGARVDTEDFSGQTPLSLLSKKHQDIIKENKQREITSWFENVLISLIGKNSQKLFKCLVKVGAHPSAINSKGISALDKLIERLLKDKEAFRPFLEQLSLHDRFTMLKKLINHLGREEREETNSEGEDERVKQLMWEISGLQSSILNDRAKLDDPDYRNETPIHLAARHGLNEILNKLIEDYPFPNVRSTSKATPLHEVFIGLKQTHPKSFYRATEQNHLKCIEILLISKGNIDLKDIQSRTPLHLISELNDLPKDFIELLLSSEEDFNVDVRNNEGMTPLHLASRCGNIHCVRSLLNSGAKPTLSNKDGLTPLHLACKLKEGSECAKLILEKVKIKGLVDVRDYQGKTPLHWACEVGNLDCVKILVEAGGTVDAYDDQKKTGEDLTNESSVIAYLKSQLKPDSPICEVQEEYDGAVGGQSSNMEA